MCADDFAGRGRPMSVHSYAMCCNGAFVPRRAGDAEALRKADSCNLYVAGLAHFAQAMQIRGGSSEVYVDLVDSDAIEAFNAAEFVDCQKRGRLQMDVVCRGDF